MMKNSKTYGRYLVLLAAGLFMAGCSSWSYSPPLRGNYITQPYNLGAVQGASSTASPFNQALGKEYASFSASLMTHDNDPADSDYFARKGLAADAGQVVPPENDANWAIATPRDAPVGFRVLLSQTRQQLMAFLDANRAGKPDLSARAQVLFDCWVEHTEQSWWTSMNGECRRDLMQILGQPMATTANVYFEFDKSNLTNEALAIVQQVATTVKGAPKVRVVLVGKADKSGTDAYNMGLSHRRADAVRAQLQRDGVAHGRIDERWVGEREPPVPTPDGVREPRNRVVEITIH
jgi:OOP family OmpA-OmpF porin